MDLFIYLIQSQNKEKYLLKTSLLQLKMKKNTVQRKEEEKQTTKAYTREYMT